MDKNLVNFVILGLKMRLDFQKNNFKPRPSRTVWLSLHYELERARQNRPFSIGAQKHRPGACKGAPEIDRLSRQQPIQDFGDAV